VHTLLLFRSPLNTLHPFTAFDDAPFLSKARQEVAKLRSLVAAELRRKYSQLSAQDRQRWAALNGDTETTDEEDLPAGRDWEKSVMCGVHLYPSMAHLHVHVLSVDRFSECLKHRKHYNSFNTPFFVEFDDLPLAQNDVRRNPTENYLKRDFTCWRCGEGFGNSFVKLKAHLAEEFEKWKAE